MDSLTNRYVFIKEVAKQAGKLAFDYFQNREQLKIERKNDDGQDLVTVADRTTEDFIRNQINTHYPQDSIFGEESGLSGDNSSYTWVVDPIDGTSAFLFGLPSWCVSIALLDEQKITQIGLVYDPVHDELFHSMSGCGAYLNETRITVNEVESLNEGLFGVGVSTRIPSEKIIPFLDNLLRMGGMFYRNGSAALMLAHVAAGKLIGYYEPHLNSWDCLSGLLLIKEAGGVTNDYKSNPNWMTKGNYVLASSPGIYDKLSNTY
ncbi:inositol-1-monophosphatase [Vibrio sp. MACH09]|uniref:inositol monophosphatase family protein n=1 Tax=Vibrio sp. MACH09 TaxID=3025122 RepID=UPI002791584E|nr:inositol monophosphatase [Vibrio sp. MACH09]GLO63483.1 inositol-1-monophosphatase [Vibrio sp. MACH09]